MIGIDHIGFKDPPTEMTRRGSRGKVATGRSCIQLDCSWAVPGLRSRTKNKKQQQGLTPRVGLVHPLFVQTRVPQYEKSDRPDPSPIGQAWPLHPMLGSLPCGSPTGLAAPPSSEARWAQRDSGSGHFLGHHVRWANTTNTSRGMATPGVFAFSSN